jgi:sec-independent protein translocase protein TatC
MSKKDLFDDTTMTFGEHLEALRFHLFRAIIGLMIGSVLGFFISRPVIIAIQEPVNEAMIKVFAPRPAGMIDKSQWESFRDWWAATFTKGSGASDGTTAVQDVSDPAMTISLDAREVARSLHEVAPDSYGLPPADAKPAQIRIPLEDTDFGKLVKLMRIESLKPRTDTPDEAFMIYLKVSLILGVIISSPWIFYQLWLFIAAGLYSHERKYVYTYLPMSIVLFLGGVAFCFFGVIPFVLKFLFEFNDWLGLRAEIKMASWITFALMVSLMFGVSFQLPLVMLFLEKISLVSVTLYREKRRHAILIIAFLSMVLTPSDPVSMMMMMLPLCVLYELGIILCSRSAAAKRSPFETQPA